MSLSSFIFAKENLHNKSQIGAPEQLSEIYTQAASWMRTPRIRIQPNELQGQNREIQTIITANHLGYILDVQITRSSGITALDKKVIRAIKQERLRSSKQNSSTQNFRVSQSFNLTATEADLNRYRSSMSGANSQCHYYFNSEVWKAQHHQDTSFKYDQQPRIIIRKADLDGKNRVIQFAFKLSRQNEISNIQLENSSGSNTIDVQVISALMNAKVSAPRKFWQFYKLKFNDSIVFDLEQCP